MACFIRIFRVLHTVQSSVFKVLFLCYCLSSNFYRISQLVVFVNHFFIFLQNFLIDHRCVLEEVFAAVFSGELYHTKAFDKCQQLF